jgi:DNA repair photolyase
MRRASAHRILSRLCGHWPVELLSSKKIQKGAKDRKLEIQYEERLAKTILTPTGGYLNSYTHSLNPYEGCAFGTGKGCPFCYVRELPLARFAGRPWGSWVRAKINAPELIEADIARFSRKQPNGKLRIFMSSSTDPYQGMESRLRLSRRILDSLAKHSSVLDLLIVQTRSPLVERDLDIFQLFGEKIWLSLSLETDSEVVRKQFTPTSASVERRLETLEFFHSADVPTQVAISPLLPCDPGRFAELLKGCCRRALVDTFQEGDGSGGRRTERLGIFDQLQSLGYGEWARPDCYQELLRALRSTLGPERVFFSQDGFNFGGR